MFSGSEVQEEPKAAPVYADSFDMRQFRMTNRAGVAVSREGERDVAGDVPAGKRSEGLLFKALCGFVSVCVVTLFGYLGWVGYALFEIGEKISTIDARTMTTQNEVQHEDHGLRNIKSWQDRHEGSLGRIVAASKTTDESVRSTATELSTLALKVSTIANQQNELKSQVKKQGAEVSSIKRENEQTTKAIARLRRQLQNSSPASGGLVMDPNIRQTKSHQPNRLSFAE